MRGSRLRWPLRSSRRRPLQSARRFTRPPEPSPSRLRDQPLVPDPVRLVRGGAELLPAERLVVADVALEEADLAVPLEGEDVGRDPVEEPAVVADDDGAAWKRLE